MPKRANKKSASKSSAPKSSAPKGPTKLQTEVDLEALIAKYEERLSELQTEVGFLVDTFHCNNRDSWGLKLRVLGVSDVAARLMFLTAKLDALVDLSRKYR